VKETRPRPRSSWGYCGPRPEGSTESPKPIVDVPSPIDFLDPDQAQTWVADTVERRPWRPRFFEAFASALNAHFDQPFTVAELGSGPGHLATVLMRSCNIASYLAIDFSPAMHDLARASLGIDAQRARFLVQDFRDDEWVTIVRGVDAVVTLQAAHEVRHKARLPALLRRIRSVIRPGGLFLFCDHYVEEGSAKVANLYLTRRQQPAALGDAGFIDIDLLRDEGGMALYGGRCPDVLQR
jgi:SAM-dependent methyltransferase